MKIREELTKVEREVENINQAMMKMLDVLATIDPVRGMNFYLHQYLGHIAEIEEAADRARREMAIYLVKERGNSRDSVAKTAKVTAMTVGRWVKNQK